MKITMKWLVGSCLVATALAGPVRAQNEQPPVPITRSAPSYPYEMRRKNIGGRVLIEFIIGTDGRVIQAQALKATRPEFIPPAVQAVLKWTFQPGTKGGRKVNVRATQVLDFDVPTYRAVAPFELLQAGRTGWATVGYWLDAQSRVKQTKVLESSDPDCGQLAEAMIALEMQAKPKWDEPPATGMYQTRYEFAAEKPAAALVKRLKKGKPPFVSAKELDQPLQPVSRQSPFYPANLRAEGKPGEAVIEFFIDEEGRALLPRVVSCSQPEFGWAAAVAVGQWTFAPPRRQGKAVTVRVQVPVGFEVAAHPE